MTVKIGGSPLRPTPGVTGGKKPETKTVPEKAAPPKSGFDTASVDPGRLTVMPRMSALGNESVQQVKGGAVEALLRDSAAEVDDYFAKAYGFEE